MWWVWLRSAPTSYLKFEKFSGFLPQFVQASTSSKVVFPQGLRLGEGFRLGVGCRQRNTEVGGGRTPESLPALLLSVLQSEGGI